MSVARFIAAQRTTDPVPHGHLPADRGVDGLVLQVGPAIAAAGTAHADEDAPHRGRHGREGRVRAGAQVARLPAAAPGFT